MDEPDTHTAIPLVNERPIVLQKVYYLHPIVAALDLNFASYWNSFSHSLAETLEDIEQIRRQLLFREGRNTVGDTV